MSQKMKEPPVLPLVPGDRSCGKSGENKQREFCQLGTCHAGMIGTRTIIESEWAPEIAKFNDVLEDWNEKTKRFAVPHPGFSNRFIHCPQCGKRLCE